MSGFLDSTVEAEFTALGSPHSVQTLDFLKKVLKGIRYADLSVASRTVTGQVKYGDGTNVAAAVTVYIKSDQVITVNTGTLVTTGNSSIQVTTNASGVFQVTIAGTQGATVEVIPASGVSSTVLVGSGGTGGGGGSSGITAKDEGSTVTGGPHTTVNFTGAGVTASDAGSGQLTVNIPGGGLTEWAAGTYPANSHVIRGPYTWRSTTSTSEDPFIVEGNLGLNTDWVVQTGGSPGMVQTPGASDGAPNGKVLLINNATGSSATAYRQRVESGFLGKMLAVDLQISGSADWLYFGILDSSASQTASDLLAAPGNTFYGVNIFIYTPSGAKIENIINGAVATNVGYVNGNATNAGSAFTRWYLKMTQNGANWDLEVLRHAWDAAANNGILPYSAYSRYQQDDLVPIARFTNVARPSYTNWRFVVGARTGGASGIFSCRAAYVRNLTSDNWRLVSRLANGF